MWDIEYIPENKMFIVNYQLPSPEIIPSIISCKYVKSKDTIETKEMTAAKKKELFNSVIYQLCIRTIHEIFEVDVINAIDAIAYFRRSKK